MLRVGRDMGVLEKAVRGKGKGSSQPDLDCADGYPQWQDK